MIVVGLTGSIGMGKSTVAQMFADCGAYVWDADAAVHRLYSRDGPAVDAIAVRFPEAVRDGAVDREVLSKTVLDNSEALKDLEAIVHPLVAQDRMRCFQEASDQDAEVFLVDIPLLFETNAQGFFNVVIVVSAPADVQRERVLARDGMSEDKFEAILAKQVPDAEKRQKADIVIETGVSLEETRSQVVSVWEDLLVGEKYDGRS